jgi:rubrerythrin
MKIKNAPGNQQAEEMDKVFDISRRRFFQLAGGIAGAGLLLSTSCNKRSGPTDVYIGEGDIALLNFLYILEQVEADFYIQAVTTPYYGLTLSESVLLTDVRDQEIAHREFFKTLLAKAAIPSITTKFPPVTFADRTSVLTHAYALEDLVISGYNAAACLFTNKDYALAVSKMVTVEARHSAYFLNLTDRSNIDVTIDSNGLDAATSPAVVLDTMGMYIETRFDSSKLPH